MTHKAKRKKTRIVSAILEVEQLDELEVIQRERSTPYANASFASVLREVVALGLDAKRRAGDSISSTSTSEQAA